MHFRIKVLAFAAGLTLATAAHADISPLDADHFLDPLQEETFALIAQDLADVGVGSVAEEDVSETAALPVQEPLEETGAATASMTAAELWIHDADPVFTEPARDDTALAEVEPILQPLETTASLSVEPSAQPLARVLQDQDTSALPGESPVTESSAISEGREEAAAVLLP